MTHKIFLSHNYKDKAVVEPVAIKLANIFGQDKIFYDSWTITPGDGIIDTMSKGLESPEFVFVFISENSLSSEMVKLEWQNALFSATRGKTKIIPIRLDQSDMPAILKQTLYIDMYTYGIEAATSQIINVIQGNSSFTPQHLGFSNLVFSQKKLPDQAIEIVIKTTHFMEPHPVFGLILDNTENEFIFETKENIFSKGFSLNGFSFTENSQTITKNAITMSLMRNLTPKNPVRIKLIPKDSSEIKFYTVVHQKGENEWKEIPNLLF